MDAYTFVRKCDENLRNAILKAYGKKCFYCGEKVNMNQLEIDHIIPDNDTKILATVEMRNYLDELKQKGFIKDCIANYLPSCGHCNKQKSNRHFTVGNLRYFYEQAINHSDKIIKNMNVFIYPSNTNQVMLNNMMPSTEREFTKDKTILSDDYMCAYAYGLGKVRVDAYLPVNIKDKLCCSILFNQSGLSDCIFSLNEEDIIYFFFQGHKAQELKDRNFIWYITDDKVAIKLPNNRFESSSDIAEQLARIVDDLYCQYYERKEQLYSAVGATCFEETGEGGFKILHMPQHIWIYMVDFAQKHDHLIGMSEWDIFHPLNLTEKNHIIVYKNHMDSTPADILAELFVENVSSHYVDVIWKPGYTQRLRPMEGFDNKIKWKVDFTHDWILSEFIPYICYLDVCGNRNIFQEIFKKTLSYKEYKEHFDCEKLGITSLHFGQ